MFHRRPRALTRAEYRRRQSARFRVLSSRGSGDEAAMPLSITHEGVRRKVARAAAIVITRTLRATRETSDVFFNGRILGYSSFFLFLLAPNCTNRRVECRFYSLRYRRNAHHRPRA